MNDTKPWYLSRTLWVNFFYIVAAALVDTQPVLPLLQGMVPAKVHTYMLFSLPIVNGILRVITSRGLIK
jgi:hypothetical protein